jgi:TetR/AcrR family transcriptional regulator, acrAB operon repressor
MKGVVMARRTKEDAEITRSRLLDAAEEVFYEKGVGGASLLDVAQAASLTRGAIYWHFKDKADLFDAMMQRATLPLEQAWQTALGKSAEAKDALQSILVVLRDVLRLVGLSASMRRVFDIAIYKVECVGEMLAVRERRLMGVKRFTEEMGVVLQLAAEQEGVTFPSSVTAAARGLHAVFDGILQAWVLYEMDPFDLEKEGMDAVHVYLRGLDFKIPKEIP